MSSNRTNIDTAAYQHQYKAMVQPFVEGPVIAVALVSRRCALRDTVVGKLGPSTYWALRARAKRKAPGLPSSVMQVDVVQNRTCDLLTLTVADGTRLEFESMRGYDFNHPLFATLHA